VVLFIKIKQNTIGKEIEQSRGKIKMELNIERLQELVIELKVLESKDDISWAIVDIIKQLEIEIMTMLKETF
jgi:hypothetical protein